MMQTPAYHHLKKSVLMLLLLLLISLEASSSSSLEVAAKHGKHGCTSATSTSEAPTFGYSNLTSAILRGSASPRTPNFPVIIVFAVLLLLLLLLLLFIIIRFLTFNGRLSCWIFRETNLMNLSYDSISLVGAHIGSEGPPPPVPPNVCRYLQVTLPPSDSSASCSTCTSRSTSTSSFDATNPPPHPLPVPNRNQQVLGDFVIHSGNSERGGVGTGRVIIAAPLSPRASYASSTDSVYYSAPSEAGSVTDVRQEGGGGGGGEGGNQNY